MNTGPSLGVLLRSPAVRQRKAEARALMQLSLLEHGARMGYRRPGTVAERLRQIADEFEQIGPRLARQLEGAA